MFCANGFDFTILLSSKLSKKVIKMFNLSGKTALVTGSTQGIGFAIAKLLAEHGAKVFINGASSIEKCERASAEIPGSVPAAADLTRDEDISRLYETTGDVDILVLNASVQFKHSWDDFSEEEYDFQFNCNVKSSYKLIKLYSKGMAEKKWGRIVTIGSVNQYNNHPELSIYGITKAAQMKLVENIAAQLAPKGITINNIAPGAIATPRNDVVLSDEQSRKSVEAKIPAGYVGAPEDIAPAVLLMCSEEGRYITGSELIIDGGMHL